MRELLRVAMNDKQVREACEQWARSRTNTGNETAAQVVVLGNGAASTVVLEVEVIFLKKRERKPKAASTADAPTF